MKNEIDQCNEFLNHTQDQLNTHHFSNMHAPFLTQDKELLSLFQNHFSVFSHLLPHSVDEITNRQARETPVHIRPLKDSPVAFNENSQAVIAVGGPPALVSLTSYFNSHEKLVYINDEEGWPIINGSVFHLEQDVATKMPLNYSPFKFIFKEFYRLFFNKESLSTIEKSGLFSWRRLDWISWIKNPKEWIVGLKLLWGIQWTLWTNWAKKEKYEEIIRDCRFNEDFYHRLNNECQGLLLPGQGSIILARTEVEVAELIKLSEQLTKEGRSLTFLSGDELIQQYGYAPEALIYARKSHDRLLSPCFKEIISNQILQKGGEVINAKVIALFTDREKGIVEYQTPEGKTSYLSFKKMLMSLGKQMVFDGNKPIYQTIAVSGVSFLALAFAPEEFIHPPLVVYGETNHTACLAGPVKVIYEGKACHLFLLRMSAGATVMPRQRGLESAYYDGMMGFGLYSAVKKALGSQWLIKPLVVYGCNRQVGKDMYMQWITHGPIKIQYGAAGGGASNAPLGVNY